MSKILKYCSRRLALPLSLLFELSHKNGVIPTEWKHANVVPVFKKGSKNKVENYRPISLTCITMKIFERIVKRELMIHTSKFIDFRQHGFVGSKSCTTNLLDFCDNIARNMNNKVRTDVVYFDFSKAFDSVHHDIILKKLKYDYGIDGLLLNFICNYLKEREQTVVLGNCKSSPKNVLSGVPQGSILGPLLFVLFINDLHRGLSNDTSIALYADDTKIWRAIKNEGDTNILQMDIDLLNHWTVINRMKFNLDKCHVLTLHNSNKNYHIEGENSPYTLGSVPLKTVDMEKDLGVDMTPKLNWEHQINRLCSKASQKLGLLRRNCFFVKDFNRARVLYIALVRSIFESCSVIWRPTNISLMRKVEGIQKRALKWVFGEENISYSCQSVYWKKCKKVNVLPMCYRFEFTDLILFHKILHGLIQINFPSYLHFYSNKSRLRFCHLDSLSLVCDIIPRTTASQDTTTNAFANSFFYRTHLSWNKLPVAIRAIDSPDEFKSKLKAHMWSRLHEDLDNNEYTSSNSDS